MSVWLRDLAKILRDANVPVREMRYTRGTFAGKKWDQVGANNSGLAAFKFVIWHHDASPVGDSPGALDWCMYGPITPAASIWVDRYGVWHIYAAGLAWHAGRGGPGWGVPKDQMNYYGLGIETDHTTGEAWPEKQIDSLRRGTAAIMDAYGINPQPGLLFHKTWTDGGIDGVPTLPTRGRKNDPDGLDLMDERRLVAQMIRQRKKREQRLSRLQRARRAWRRRRNTLKAKGKKRGLPTAQRKIADLTRRIKLLR